MPVADYDVAVVGGGIVGNTLACGLLQNGFRVALIEASDPIDFSSQIVPNQQETQDFDLRTFALTHASVRIFEYLQVWDAMAAQRVSPFREMYVWDANGTGAIHFDSAVLKAATLGYIVEQAVLQAALTARLQQFEHLTLYRPTCVEKFSLDANCLNVQLQNGQSLTTYLLVGAEGAHSSVRTLAGIAYDLHDYAQQAIVATVQTEHPHQATAWQRFLTSGPLAFLPLSNPHLCSIVWSADTPKAQRLIQLESTVFQTMLGEAFAHKLGHIIDSSERSLFPLQSRHAQAYVKPRIALVGDAAHTVHPLAGQGVNLGLLDAAALLDVLLTAQQQHKDIGAYTLLRRYERWRKGDNLAVQATMSGFKYLFSNEIFPLTWVRNTGLSLTNAATPVKHLIMARAMGFRGDLPRIAQ